MAVLLINLIQVSPHSVSPHVYDWFSWLGIIDFSKYTNHLMRIRSEVYTWAYIIHVISWLVYVPPAMWLSIAESGRTLCLPAGQSDICIRWFRYEGFEGWTLFAAGCFCSYTSLVLLNTSQFIQTVVLLLVLKLLSPTIWMPPTQNGPDLFALTAEGHQNKGTWHGGGLNLLTAVWSKASHFLFTSRLKRFRNTWKRCTGERGS